MQIIFMNSDFGEKITAIEKAAMLRNMLFKKYFDLDVIFMTVKYNPRCNSLKNSYIDKGMMHNQNYILNIYDYFQGIDRACSGYEKINVYPDCEFELKKNDLHNYEKISMPFEKSLIIKFTNDNKIDFINHTKQKKLVRSDKYDEFGFLSRTQILNSQGQVISKIYYRKNETIALQEYFEIKNNVSLLQNIQIFDASGKHTDTVQNYEELIALWLSIFFKTTKDKYFCIIDRNNWYKQFFITHKNTGNIFSAPVLHSVHYGINGDLQSSNSNYDSFIEKKCTHDAILTLTDLQNEDIKKRLEVQNVYTIPHVIENLSLTNSCVRIPHRLVYAARLIKIKEHNTALKIFNLVQQKVQDAELFIYGNGVEEENIRKQIKELGLEKKVFLAGYSEDINSIFQSAGLSILTSTLEGLPMSVLESLNNGCPVVSFDIRYGPSAMIVNGKNGYLIPYGNITDFAEKIIHIFENPDLWQRMSVNAKRIVKERFSEEIIAKKWKELLDLAEESLLTRTLLSNANNI